MDKIPDPEVPERPTRRHFSGAYKAAILHELDQATEPGAKGAIMRREGLYSSSITEWRKQRAAGNPHALGRSHGPRGADPLVAENEERFVKRIEPGPVATGRLVLAPDGSDETIRIRRVIKSWPDDGGTRAILARTNAELLPAAVVALDLRAASLNVPILP